MLSGQRLYLDVHDKGLMHKLETEIGHNGGKVEKFLSKDISCVITTKGRAALKRGNAGSKSTQQAPTACLSRGKALLLQSKQQATSKNANDPLMFANKWGIACVQIKDFLRKHKICLEGDENKDCSSSTAKSVPRAKVKAIPGPCIKFEDVQALYKPYSQSFDSFPLITDLHRFHSKCAAADKNIAKQESKPIATKEVSPRVPSTHAGSVAIVKQCNSASKPVEVGEPSHTTHRGKRKDRVKVREPSDSTHQSKRKEGVKKTNSTKDIAKSGYCESCDQFYTSVKEHVASQTHQQFATNKENFAVLDATIQGLPGLGDLLSAVHTDSDTDKPSSAGDHPVYSPVSACTEPETLVQNHLVNSKCFPQPTKHYEEHSAVSLSQEKVCVESPVNNNNSIRDTGPSLPEPPLQNACPPAQHREPRHFDVDKFLNEGAHTAGQCGGNEVLFSESGQELPSDTLRQLDAHLHSGDDFGASWATSFAGPQTGATESYDWSSTKSGWDELQVDRVCDRVLGILDKSDSMNDRIGQCGMTRLPLHEICFNRRPIELTEGNSCSGSPKERNAINGSSKEAVSCSDSSKWQCSCSELSKNSTSGVGSAKQDNSCSGSSKEGLSCSESPKEDHSCFGSLQENIICIGSMQEGISCYGPLKDENSCRASQKELNTHSLSPKNSLLAPHKQLGFTGLDLLASEPAPSVTRADDLPMPVLECMTEASMEVDNNPDLLPPDLTLCDAYTPPYSRPQDLPTNLGLDESLAAIEQLAEEILCSQEGPGLHTPPHEPMEVEVTAGIEEQGTPTPLIVPAPALGQITHSPTGTEQNEASAAAGGGDLDLLPANNLPASLVSENLNGIVDLLNQSVGGPDTAAVTCVAQHPSKAELALPGNKDHVGIKLRISLSTASCRLLNTASPEQSCEEDVDISGFTSDSCDNDADVMTSSDGPSDCDTDSSDAPRLKQAPGMWAVSPAPGSLLKLQLRRVVTTPKSTLPDQLQWQVRRSGDCRITLSPSAWAPAAGSCSDWQGSPTGKPLSTVSRATPRRRKLRL